MTQKRSAQQTAPNADVRVRIRLTNSGKLKREVTLPSSYPLFADIVAKAIQSGEEVTEVLSGVQMDAIIDSVYIEVAKSARLKSETVQAALDGLTHTLNGMRLYKLRAVGSRRRNGTADNARIVWAAKVTFA